MPHRLYAPGALIVAAMLLLEITSTSPAARGQNAPAASGGVVDFARDVKPILATHCYECDGAQKQKGGLRLDSKRHVFEGGDAGVSPIKPGDPKTSHLMQLVRGDE